MRRSVSIVACVVAVGCEPVALRVEVPAPRAQPPRAPETPPPTPDPACPNTCTSGRACVRGECLPHWVPIASPEVSTTAPRVGQYAVWTGREVLVWGGHDPRGGAARAYADGFRYDPARGEVRAMSAASAPPGRYDDGTGVAVWTGREMMIWGGRGDGGALSDGVSYDALEDRWLRSSAASPRAGFTAVYTGDSVVLAGLGDPGDTWRWDPSSRVWVRLTMSAGARGARRGQSAVWTGSELVVWGGADDVSGALSDGWRVSPLRRRTRPTSDAGAGLARWGHAAVWAESQMLVFGGRDASGRALAALASYVPASDAWRELQSAGAPSPRYGHVAAWTGRSLVVWGGTDGRRVLDDGAEYDPWDDAWTTLPAAPVDGPSTRGREGAVGVWTGAELVVIGGWDGSDRVSPLGWRYQP